MIFRLLALAAALAPWVCADGLEFGDVKIGFESRARFETRPGQAFGRDPDLSTGLVRTRLSLTYEPASWIRVSGMVQDARAPWYGSNAPATVRDSADLQESYIELFPDRETGFGATAGRMMLNYGEGRLIGTPQWSNVARTYDHVRLYYRTARARTEFLLVSPVKVRPLDFNRPVLGDRVWGTYNTIAVRKAALDVYALRHEVASPGRLRVNTFGVRASGPLSAKVKYAVEAVGQPHRGWAWSSWVARRWSGLSVTAEYKYASASFDQLYPANHDKFGHQDLFGWRNLHDTRGLATWSLTSNVSLNCMYNNLWLASAAEALYNGSGKQIVRSSTRAGGRHVGQSADLFGTYKHGALMFGAGVGRFFTGDYIRFNTPNTAPAYAYLFESYSF